MSARSCRTSEIFSDNCEFADPGADILQTKKEEDQTFTQRNQGQELGTKGHCWTFFSELREHYFWRTTGPPILNVSSLNKQVLLVLLSENVVSTLCRTHYNPNQGDQIR